VELNAIRIILIVSASIFVIGRLIASHSALSRKRAVIKSLSTIAMYVAIATIFVALTKQMHAAGFIFGISWSISSSILVIGWLAISFTPPSRGRTIVEWFSVIAMYAAILTIFSVLIMKMHAAGFIFAAWAVGVLSVMLFGGGFLVSTWKAIAALGAEKKAQSSATN
jgi:hypothetical protein